MRRFDPRPSQQVRRYLHTNLGHLEIWCISVHIMRPNITRSVHYKNMCRFDTKVIDTGGNVGSSGFVHVNHPSDWFPLQNVFPASSIATTSTTSAAVDQTTMFIKQTCGGETNAVRTCLKMLNHSLSMDAFADLLNRIKTANNAYLHIVASAAVIKFLQELRHALTSGKNSLVFNTCPDLRLLLSYLASFDDFLAMRQIVKNDLRCLHMHDWIASCVFMIEADMSIVVEELDKLDRIVVSAQ